MSSNSINSLSSSYLQSILTSALKSDGVTTNASGPLTTQSDNTQLSPFAQLASTLQQLQQSNPAEYQQVTQTIAANLTTAAQSAQSGGNTNAANQLTQLASDFTTASQNGQLPNLQDLAQATSGANGTSATGGHHHHHHHAAAASSSDSGSDSSQSSSVNPLSIIANTLSSAGVTGSNG